MSFLSEYNIVLGIALHFGRWRCWVKRLIMKKVPYDLNRGLFMFGRQGNTILTSGMRTHVVHPDPATEKVVQYTQILTKTRT